MTGAFILGTSRSGSTMLSNVINTHPDILSVSELLSCQGTRALLDGKIPGELFWRQLSTPTYLMSKLANPLAAPQEFLYHHVANKKFNPFRCPPLLAVTLPHIASDPDALFESLEERVSQLPHQSISDHYRALFAMLMNETKGGVWVERSGGSLVAARSLIEFFPEAKFIVISRDGRDVALSLQKYRPARFAIWFWKWARRFGIDILDPKRHVGRSELLLALEQSIGRILPIDRILEQTPPLKECAKFWSQITLSGLASLKILPRQKILMLSYEKVTQDPVR